MTQAEKRRLLWIMEQAVKMEQRRLNATPSTRPADRNHAKGRMSAFDEVCRFIEREPVTDRTEPTTCPCGNPLDDDPTRPEGICQECR